MQYLGCVSSMASILPREVAKRAEMSNKQQLMVSFIQASRQYY